MLCIGDKPMTGANAKVLNGMEAKPASTRTQLWPDTPHAMPIQEKLLSANYEKRQIAAAQSGCRCRR